MAAFKAWCTLTAIGTLSMLAIQWTFRRLDPFLILPIAQAAGLWIAWVIAWPLWFRQRPGRRYGFVGHSLTMLVVVAAIAAARLVFRTG